MQRYHFNLEFVKEYVYKMLSDVINPEPRLHIKGEYIYADENIPYLISIIKNIDSDGFCFFNLEIINYTSSGSFIISKLLLRSNVFVGKKSYEEIVRYIISNISRVKFAQRLCDESREFIYVDNDYSYIKHSFPGVSLLDEYVHYCGLAQYPLHISYRQSHSTRKYISEDHPCILIMIKGSQNKLLNITQKDFFSGKFLSNDYMKSFLDYKSIFVIKMKLIQEIIHQDIFPLVLRLGFNATFGLGCRIL